MISRFLGNTRARDILGLKTLKNVGWQETLKLPG